MKGSYYNFIIRSTTVVPPCRFLHHTPRHRFKIHEVVALAQRRLVRHSCQPCFFLWRHLLVFYCSHCCHVDGTQVLFDRKILVEGVGRVDRIELLCRVLTRILEDDLAAPWVLGQKFGYVVCFPLRIASPVIPLLVFICLTLSIFFLVCSPIVLMAFILFPFFFLRDKNHLREQSPNMTQHLHAWPRLRL